MKYDLIIFDCDGTLVDSEYLVNKAFSEVMIAEGFEKYTIEYCLETFVGFAYPDMCDLIIKEHPEINFKEIEERFVERANALIPTELKEIPNAAKLLEELGDHPRCVASNGEQPVVLYSLKSTGLLKFFDKNHVFTYEMVENGKPEPDLFLYAAKKMGVNPSKCLVIEDSLIGTIAAKAAGMDVISIVSRDCGDANAVKDKLNELNPLAIIDDLLEVKPYVA